jgi:hypothetical protein
MPVASKTTAVLLQSYLASAGESGIKLIASFTGAVPSTVRNWESKKLPGGLYLLRLRYLLEILGQAPSELQDLSPPPREFGRLLALRVITEEEALSITGYPNKETLQDVLLRGAGYAKVRGEAMTLCAQERASEMSKQWEHFVRNGRFPSTRPTRPGELLGADVTFDKFGEPSGKPIFEGSIQECFMFLASDIRITEMHLKELVDWVGAVWHPTGRDWARGKKFPKGMFLLKLGYYLEQAGFGVEELQALNPDLRLFGRMMAFGLLELHEAVGELGYAPGNGQAVLSSLLRGQAMMPNPQKRLKRYVKDQKQELAEAVRKFRSNPELSPHAELA